MIHFVGGGNMATAMIEGLEALPTSPEIAIIDPSEAARVRHREAGRVTFSAIAEAKQITCALLAFKHPTARAPLLRAIPSPVSVRDRDRAGARR